MGLSPEYVTSPPAPKRTVAGIHGSDSTERLIQTLANLGLCSSDLATPLKKLAAAGGKVSDHLKISVHDLDQALAGVAFCPISNRIAFKTSLARAGMLTVPK
jgi:hypothetical protein